ncbi:MAG: ketose 1,6-bisphosphate aldolase [Alphaproteobacteria bacterium]
MTLISLKQAVEHAKANQYALGSFNVSNLNLFHAIMAAAKAKRSPVIISLAEVHLNYAAIQEVAPIVRNVAHQTDIPVVLHLDHGLTYPVVVEAIRSGFSSVMFDGSALPYEENIKQTAEVVKMAHAVGVSVEAELGAIGGDEGGGLYGEANEAFFTDPKMAKDFVERTGIDCLAVSIGNVHGMYKGEPKLDFPRLQEIEKITGMPLVLHGGSGISDDDFRKAITMGIRKINFYTGMSQVALKVLKESLDNPEPGYDHYAQALASVEKPVQKTVEHQMDVFGSANKC